MDDITTALREGAQRYRQGYLQQDLTYCRKLTERNPGAQRCPMTMPGGKFARKSATHVLLYHLKQEFDKAEIVTCEEVIKVSQLRRDYESTV